MRGVDVVVVGAGPAGAAAAVEVARSGRSVVLADRARFPRDKCCGDGLTTGALRQLEQLGLDPAAVPSWQPVDDVVLRSADGVEVGLPLPRHAGTYAAVARRAELDAALVDVARRAGAEVFEGHACTGTTTARGDDHVRVELDGIGTVAARYVIAADGMWSPVRKHLGAAAPGYLGEWHAFRQYFADVGRRASSELFVWFEPDIAPGYVWSFPLADGRANVGFGVLRGGDHATRDMKALWPELLARPHVRAVLGPSARPEAPHRAWPIPARIERTTLTAAGGRALFVGDAAAAADPLTGEGIGQALLTGRLAARAVCVAGALAPGRAASRYRDAVARELVPDARMAGALLRVLHHPRPSTLTLRLVGSSAWTRRNFARWLFEDYPRALVLTPGRWREHGLHGAGAYAGPTMVAPA